MTGGKGAELARIARGVATEELMAWIRAGHMVSESNNGPNVRKVKSHRELPGNDESKLTQIYKNCIKATRKLCSGQFWAKEPRKLIIPK